MKIWKIIAWLILIVVVSIAGFVVYDKFLGEKDPIEVASGEPSDIEGLVRLCSVEIYTELPVLDTIDNKVIFGVQKQRGSITFDIENLEVKTDGDTVRAILPAEIVELHEGTDKDSWEVIDTKAIGPLSFLRSDKLSISEENRVKSKIKKKSITRLYQNGTVKRAREEGRLNLERLLEHVYRKPVVVTDTVT